MAKNLRDDISRSMAWLRGSLSLSPPGQGEVPADQRGTRNPVRDLLADLIAYVLFFLDSCEQRCPAVSEVRERIKALVDEQEKRARSGEVPWESYLEARFAALSWVDEMILTSGWPNRNQWQHLMLAYHGTLNAGEEFFARLERLPSDARDVREIYYLCLKLGFLGKHALDDGSHQLGTLQHTLYRQLSGSPNDIRQSYPRLFPEAYQRAREEKRPVAPRIHLLWFGLAVLLPLLVFGTYWLILRGQTNRLLERISAAPPLVQAPTVDWIRSLIEELRRRNVEVQETPRGVVVTLPGLLFEVNRSELNPAGEKKIEEVALIVKRYAPDRRVAVEGHASREKGTLDEINQRLSEDRAKNAADVVVRSGFVREKVPSKGFGSSTPVASNDTEEGRRKNRRIEIIIEKAGS